MATVIESREFWEQQLEQFKVSGVSRSQYCRDHIINYDRFGYWLKKLSPVVSKFIPVTLQAPELSSSHSMICTLELRGHVLKIYNLSALSFVLERLA